MVGKQAIVENLKRQVSETQHQLQGEIAQYQHTEAASQAAHQAVDQAQSQVNTLRAALATAEGTAQTTSQTAAKAANAAAVQHEMVVDTKRRLAAVLGQLQAAGEQLRETEASAHRAQEAAQQAQSNAAAAASKAGGHYGHHSSYY